MRGVGAAYGDAPVRGQQRRWSNPSPSGRASLRQRARALAAPVPFPFVAGGGGVVDSTVRTGAEERAMVADLVAAVLEDAVPEEATGVLPVRRPATKSSPSGWRQWPVQGRTSPGLGSSVERLCQWACVRSASC
ncbi:hypothetical protein GCM10020254_83510 [Streptomyces goshikiensis]